MKTAETSLPGVLLLTLQTYRDRRGAFMETYNERTMAEAGLPTVWPQDNFSVSAKNVLRGIHYQLTRPQGKLIRVTQGTALDVVVDLRRGSPTFGRYLAVELDGERAEMLWIPPGFGHAFLAMSDRVGMAYKVTEFFYPAGERTIAWNDHDLSIAWPIAPEEVILSDKDRRGIPLRHAELFP